MSLPCHLHHEANLHAGILVGAAETIHNKQALAAQLLDSKILYSSPSALGNGLVIVGVTRCGPPYGVVAIGIVYDEFVLRRAACVHTGHHVDGAQFGLLTLVKAFQTGFHLLVEQNLITGVVQNLGNTSDTVLLC